MDCKEITFTIAHPFTGKSSGVVIRDMDNRVDVIGAPWMWTHIKRILKECSGLEYHNLVDKIKFIQSDIIRDAIANNNKEQCHL